MGTKTHVILPLLDVKPSKPIGKHHQAFRDLIKLLKVQIDERDSKIKRGR